MPLLDTPPLHPPNRRPQYPTDNYSFSLEHHTHPGDWLDLTSRTHPCYDPKKVRLR